MKRVLVVGYPDRMIEFKQLPLQNAQVDYLDQIYFELEGGELDFLREAGEDDFYLEHPDLTSYDVIFDLSLDECPDNLIRYAQLEETIVIGCAVKQSLAHMVAELGIGLDCDLFGMNALPTFIHRPLMEVSCLNADNAPLLQATLQELGLAWELVEDRVGMVSARVVCMIINEAYFLAGEGTADPDAVDNAMKLGTNYPRGPFEWAEEIGLETVVDVLEGMGWESADSRYKIAPLLRKRGMEDALIL